MLDKVTEQAPPPAGGEQAEALPSAVTPPPPLRRPRLTTCLFTLARPRTLLLAGLLVLGWFGGSLAVAQVRGWYPLRCGRTALQAHHNRQAAEHLEACLRIWPAEP